MRNYLMTKAPWWLLVLINGGWFWIINSIGRALAPSFGWPADIFGGLISGVIFGLFTATAIVWARRRRRRASATTGQN